MELISALDYGDGTVGHLFSGGVTDSLASDLPTGILRVSSLHDVFSQNPEINWATLAELAQASNSHRIAYVARVVNQAFHRKTFPGNTDGKPALVLHLNTYQRVPLYSETRTSGVPASFLSGYGFPAVYTSPVERTSAGYVLSSCSRDILVARARQYLDYNRGVLYEVPLGPKSVFHIDRKINVEYQNWFISKALARANLAKPPGTDEFCSTLTDLFERWRALPDQRDKLDLTIEICRALRFSIVGFCLFEIIHEFLSLYSMDVSWCNSGLADLDPYQKQHWSMRAFNVKSSDDLERVFASRLDPLPVDAFTTFLDMFDQDFMTKLKVFTGDDNERLEACALNNLFNERLHELGKTEAGLDPSWDLIPDHLADSGSGGTVIYDGTRKRVTFPAAFQVEKTLSELGNSAWDQWLRGAIGRRSIKLVHLRASESMAANSIKLMLLNEIGPLAVPFQPDIRGELLLTPVSTLLEQPLASQLVRVTEEPDGRYSVNPDPGAFRAPILVRDSTSFDPTLRHLPDALYLRESFPKAATYRTIFEDVFADVNRNLPRWISEIPVGKPISIVVVPFFKEARSHIDVVVQTVSEIRQRRQHAGIVFVSNQPADKFSYNVALAEASVADVMRDGGCSIWPVNTGAIRDMQYFMIEKYINVHIGARISQEIHNATGHLGRTFFLEGDVIDAGAWLDAYFRQSDEADVTVFQFEVGVRDEGDTKPPRRNYSGSDAILAKLFATPLCHIVLGSPIEQLFGGNFTLTPDALADFVDRLTESDHSESLVEAWLPLLMSGRRTRVINVAPKIHLPALKAHLWSTDTKFVKWVFDLSFALHKYIVASPGAMLTNLKGDEPPVYAFDRETKNQRKKRLTTAARNYGYSRQVYRDVLPESLQLQYEQVFEKALGGDVPSGAVSDDAWIETVWRFFDSIRGQRLAEVEERLFALRALYDFKLLSLGDNPTPALRPVAVSLAEARSAIAVPR